jgi:hypothetical protein
MADMDPPQVAKDAAVTDFNAATIALTASSLRVAKIARLLKNPLAEEDERPNSGSSEPAPKRPRSELASAAARVTSPGTDKVDQAISMLQVAVVVFKAWQIFKTSAAILASDEPEKKKDQAVSNFEAMQLAYGSNSTVATWSLPARKSASAEPAAATDARSLPLPSGVGGPAMAAASAADPMAVPKAEGTEEEVALTAILVEAKLLNRAEKVREGGYVSVKELGEAEDSDLKDIGLKDPELRRLRTAIKRKGPGNSSD